jgi:hypothetical protein
MKGVDPRHEWETLGLLLDEFNTLEHEMAQVICSFLKPAAERAEFLETIVLHNAVAPFAAKVKMLLAIAKVTSGPRLDRDKFHRLLNIRNAFAHGRTIAGLRINRNALRDEPHGAYLIIETLLGDGSFKQEVRAAAAGDAFRLLEELRKSVETLKQHVGAQS